MILLVFVLIFIALAWPKEGLRGIATDRKYKSGTGWCVWRWTDVDSDYITRLHLFKTPWFAACLHWIKKADAEPWLHDHPVSFLSVILRGQYAEIRKRGDERPRIQLNRWFNFIRASKDDRHRIILARPGTLTLALMGPKTREWGFHVWTEIDPSGWLHWKEYYARLHAGEDVRRRGAGLDTIMTAAQEANKLMQKWESVHTGPHVDEEVRELDTGEAAPFNADEVTWPGDHK